MSADSLVEMVVALKPEDQDAVREFIEFLRQRAERPESPFLSAADEFIAEHPDLLRRLAQ
ncbi:MAG: hypothetical protein JST11_11670 [Acidobacteria bacterium]|nr:hypothetical protein [Acidobacteriota bacterium]